MKQSTAEKLITLTQEGYNQIASSFSQTRQYSWADFKIFKKYLQKMIKYNTPFSVLDIGCGNGRIIDFITKISSKFTYIGIDFSQNLLKQAQKKYPDHQFLHENILNQHFIKSHKGSFDVIFSIAVLNHIPSKKLQIQALQNMHDLLKPNGILFMTNWNLWKLSLKKKSVFKYKFNREEQQKILKFLKNHNINKNELGFQDIITIWKSNTIKAPLYYYAFTKSHIKKRAHLIKFKILENQYSHKKIYKGGNIITVLQK